MAIHTIGTAGTTSLLALSAWTDVLPPADIGAIAASLVEDWQFVSNTGTGTVGPQAVIATGGTHTNVTLDGLAVASGPPVSQIRVNDIVLGPGIPAGTFVRAVSGTTVTLSQAATATAAGVNVAFVRQDGKRRLSAQGLLEIPGRGVLKVFPGDYVVLDPVTGWPILLSGNEVSLTGSVWTFT